MYDYQIIFYIKKLNYFYEGNSYMAEQIQNNGSVILNQAREELWNPWQPLHGRNTH